MPGNTNSKDRFVRASFYRDFLRRTQPASLEAAKAGLMSVARNVSAPLALHSTDLDLRTGPTIAPWRTSRPARYSAIVGKVEWKHGLHVQATALPASGAYVTFPDQALGRAGFCRRVCRVSSSVVLRFTRCIYCTFGYG